MNEREKKTTDLKRKKNMMTAMKMLNKKKKKRKFQNQTLTSIYTGEQLNTYGEREKERMI